VHFIGLYCINVH